jgi:hypothetical protein
LLADAALVATWPSTATPRFSLIFYATPPVKTFGFVFVERSDGMRFLGQLLIFSKATFNARGKQLIFSIPRYRYSSTFVAHGARSCPPTKVGTSAPSSLVRVPIRHQAGTAKAHAEIVSQHTDETNPLTPTASA